MWKKEDQPATPSPAPPETRPGAGRPERAELPGPRATIGRSITIHGEVTGDEDLRIQGRVEGSVKLDQHSVTIGAEGEVKASISAREIIVEGKVEGNLRAEELIVLKGKADVNGDVAAPRVVLDDGARLRGGVDMGERLRPGSTTGGAGARAGAAGLGGPKPLEGPSRAEGRGDTEASTSAVRAAAAAK
jgi:cytoskeletal protein CcmA (bactofilin family)